MWSQARSLALAACLLLGGCCTGDRCLDERSGPDKDRVTAPRVKLELVYNDSVSGDKRDRTDWKYVMLTRPGKLTVALHWDNGKARLELDVFDVMGIKIQEGRVWGTGGLRAVVVAEEPGPYYIRVRSAGAGDESQYAVRISFQPDAGGVPAQCTDCRQGDRKCLGNDGFVTCEKLGPGCNAWGRTVQCPGGISCRNGICDPCAAPCPVGTMRCTGNAEYQTCEQQAEAGCPLWSTPKSCPTGQRCHDGRCSKRHTGTKVVTKVDPRPEPRPQAQTQAKIISIYRYRGVWTLHIEIGDNPAVKPGQAGTVLDGETGRPLAGGAIHITKVTGRFAIATTSLQQLGKNRWVRIETK